MELLVRRLAIIATMVAAISALCFIPTVLKNQSDSSRRCWSSATGGVNSHTGAVRSTPSPFAARPFGALPLPPLKRRLVVTSAATTDILPTVREGVADAGGTAEWNASVEMLQNAMTEVDVEEAETILANALGWRSWAVVSEKMRRFQRPITPDSEKLATALKWLSDGPLAMDKTQTVAAIKASPKVYLIDPEGTYKKAISAAPKDFKDEDTFKALCLEDPSVMECTYNCEDDGCASECGNCWVSYKIRA